LNFFPLIISYLALSDHISISKSGFTISLYKFRLRKYYTLKKIKQALRSYRKNVCAFYNFKLYKRKKKKFSPKIGLKVRGLVASSNMKNTHSMDVTATSLTIVGK